MRVLHVDMLLGNLIVEVEDAKDETRIGQNLRDNFGRVFHIKGISFPQHRLGTLKKFLFLSGPSTIGETVEII